MFVTRVTVLQYAPGMCNSLCGCDVRSDVNEVCVCVCKVSDCSA